MVDYYSAMHAGVKVDICSVNEISLPDVHGKHLALWLPLPTKYGLVDSLWDNTGRKLILKMFKINFEITCH